MRAGCLLASDDRKRSPAWYLGCNAGRIALSRRPLGRPPICFLAGRRARMTAKLCGRHEEAWIGLLAGFMPAFGGGPKSFELACQGLSLQLSSHRSAVPEDYLRYSLEVTAARICNFRRYHLSLCRSCIVSRVAACITAAPARVRKRV